MKKQHVGLISGVELMKHRSGKLNSSDGIVTSGTGYHTDKNQYNRKSKKNQQLKNRLKDNGFEAFFKL